MSKKSILKPRKKPTQERAKATVHTIYEAALELFSRYGYGPITTDKIAERAGVSIGTLYQYFPNKESILIGMWEQIFNTVVIDGTTHSLAKPDFIQAETNHIKEMDNSYDKQHVDDINFMEGLPGIYTGGLTGVVGGSVFNIKHQFKMKSIWTFDVGEKLLKLDIKEIPVIGKITGTGSVEPRTGFAKMIFNVPLFGEMPGTGWIDINKNISFHIPRFDFSFVAHIAENGSASGSWNFAFSFIVVKMFAKGDMSGTLLTT